MQNKKNLSGIALLQQMFPGQVKFSLAELAKIIHAEPQTMRNWISEKNKKRKDKSLNKQRSARHHRFDIRHVAKLIDGEFDFYSEEFHEEINRKNITNNAKIGRPKKRVQIANAATLSSEKLTGGGHA
jgi:hypothetical protein